MKRETWEMLERLKRAGISERDALALRRISMTLHRWHELECGIGDRDIIYIERDEETGKVYMCSGNTGQRWPTPDRETGALKRLAAIMARYPDKQSYVQGDPRGAALYILQPGNVPEGKDVDSYYSQGIAIYA